MLGLPVDSWLRTLRIVLKRLAANKRLVMSPSLPMSTIKAWSEMLGLTGRDARAPLRPLSRAQKDELRRDLVQAGLLAGTAVAAE